MLAKCSENNELYRNSRVRQQRDMGEVTVQISVQVFVQAFQGFFSKRTIRDSLLLQNRQQKLKTSFSLQYGKNWSILHENTNSVINVLQKLQSVNIYLLISICIFNICMHVFKRNYAMNISFSLHLLKFEKNNKLQRKPFQTSDALHLVKCCDPIF